MQHIKINIKYVKIIYNNVVKLNISSTLRSNYHERRSEEYHDCCKVLFPTFMCRSKFHINLFHSCILAFPSAPTLAFCFEIFNQNSYFYRFNFLLLEKYAHESGTNFDAAEDSRKFSQWLIIEITFFKKRNISMLLQETCVFSD